MSSASMQLLKKPGKAADTKAAAEEMLPATAAAEVETAEVEIDKMDEAELAALVTEHVIAVPSDWKKLGLDEKKAWLNAQFGGEEAGETEAEVQTTAQAEPAAEAVAEKPAKAAKADKKAKPGKEVAVSNAKTGGVVETPGEDAIVDMAHEMSNLSEADARELVVTLREDSELTFFKLGGVLSQIQAKGWFEPYASLKDFIEQEHGMNYRRAMYYIEIYNCLVESGVPWSKVAQLGWTKLQAIAKLITPKNVDKWVKLAMKQTVLQLQASVKAEEQKKLEGGKESEDGEVGAEAKTVTTKTFKLHDDQKKTIEAALKKAREASGTDVDTAALEFICLDFLGGNFEGTSSVLAQIGMDKALEAFAQAFPDAKLALEMDEAA
jgi:hypothetical protein